VSESARAFRRARRTRRPRAARSHDADFGGRAGARAGLHTPASGRPARVGRPSPAPSGVGECAQELVAPRAGRPAGSCPSSVSPAGTEPSRAGSRSCRRRLPGRGSRRRDRDGAPARAGMIGSTRTLRVWAYPAPADLRKGFDGLGGS